MNRFFTVVMSLASVTLFSGFDCGPPPVLLDTGFDMWCGEDLCAWKVEDGRINRVPTWHRSDFGAELAGNPTILSQRAIALVSCVEFNLQIDRDDNVTVYIEMDFQDDGSVEYSHPITADDFKPANYFITPPTWYDSVRFYVRKVGVGRAVLAQIVVRDGDGCQGAPIELGDRPLGAPCDRDSDCLSGNCSEVAHWLIFQEENRVKSCGGCELHSDCQAGEVCGLEFGSQDYPYRDCGLPARHELGERCDADEECATGVCCEGSCSECCGEESCPAGSQCERRDPDLLGQEYEGQVFPYQCSPGAGLGLAGSVCLHDDDCQSGQCQGESFIKTCALAGNSCLIDEDCGSVFQACLHLGTHGGQCQ